MAKVNYEKIWKELKESKQKNYRLMLEMKEEQLPYTSTMLTLKRMIGELEIELSEMDEREGSNDQQEFVKQLCEEGVYDRYHEMREKTWNKRMEEESDKENNKDSFVSWAWSNQETGEKESPFGSSIHSFSLHMPNRSSSFL